VFAAHVPATDDGHSLEVVRGAAGAVVVRGTPLLAANPFAPLGCDTVSTHIDTSRVFAAHVPATDDGHSLEVVRGAAGAVVVRGTPLLAANPFHPLVAILCQHT
jgi:hypothetical protein